VRRGGLVRGSRPALHAGLLRLVNPARTIPPALHASLLRLVNPVRGISPALHASLVRLVNPARAIPPALHAGLVRKAGPARGLGPMRGGGSVREDDHVSVDYTAVGQRQVEVESCSRTARNARPRRRVMFGDRADQADAEDVADRHHQLGRRRV